MYRATAKGSQGEGIKSAKYVIHCPNSLCFHFDAHYFSQKFDKMILGSSFQIDEEHISLLKRSLYM